jgi:hypothetical protein
MAGVQEVAADLMESTGSRFCFEKGELAGKPFEDFKIGLGFAERSAFFFAERFAASPGVFARVSHDDGEVGFFDELIVESRAKDADDPGIGGKEQYSARGTVDPMKGVNGLPDLITEDLHRDLVIRVGVIGGVDELSRRFVHCDD